MSEAHTPVPALEARFRSLGVAVIEYARCADDLAQMDAIFPTLSPKMAGARASDFTPAALAWLDDHAALRELAHRLAGQSAPALRLSRVLAFDTSPETNWFVAWHQDRAEDGRDRPCTDLEQTVALRIHLDDCSEDNGPLEVLPGSHVCGRLNSASIAGLIEPTPPLLCLAARGDIVAMRPLLVHRSHRARAPTFHRRVLHLEYGTGVSLWHDR